MNLFKIIVILGLMFSALFGATEDVPTQYGKKLAKVHYGWLSKYPTATLGIYTDSITKQFMSNNEISTYFKLRLRNFVSDVKIVKDPKSKSSSHNYIGITIQLQKYNDKLGIYFGLIEFIIFPSIDSKSFENYRITYSIAGSDGQIKSEIKSDIDSMVEKFASDYFFIKDMK